MCTSESLPVFLDETNRAAQLKSLHACISSVSQLEFLQWKSHMENLRLSICIILMGRT